MEYNFEQLSDEALEPIQVDKISERRTLRKRKEKVHKHLKLGVNEKEMDSFTKRVLQIPLDNPFKEAYFTHRLWMFFRETKETEQDIHRIFDQIREKMKRRITLKKKSSSVSILPKVMSDHLGLRIEPSHDSFTFVDHSTRNSGGIIRDLEVQIGNALVPVDFHVLDNKQNKNRSLLLGRDFMATVGAVCNMQTNQLCSWAEESFHESFAVNTEQPETRSDEYDEDYHREKIIEYHGLAMND
ncbi:hypothetical protein DY000_02048840 [Brassica cretica]|uniref:Uncharacterized protein n=1 Tax=Brassica cretica TaxID=69181 RepID=A0ABQ7F5N6_BRACR|nr:hypothetical protein DY000_02048840 [Brassica cretica]